MSFTNPFSYQNNSSFSNTEERKKAFLTNKNSIFFEKEDSLKKPKPGICILCNYYFKTENLLKKHVDSNHSLTSSLEVETKKEVLEIDPIRIIKRNFSSANVEYETKDDESLEVRSFSDFFCFPETKKKSKKIINKKLKGVEKIKLKDFSIDRNEKSEVNDNSIENPIEKNTSNDNKYWELEDVKRHNSNLKTESDSSFQYKAENIILNKEQQAVLNSAMEGNSMFITGSAGTGKSALLHSIIKSLKLKYPPESIAVTASTGIAAIELNGQTIHSLADHLFYNWSSSVSTYCSIMLGIYAYQSLLEKEVIKASNSSRVRKRWKKLKVLIIDEISMVSAQLLETINFIAQRTRKSILPFGGIQLIFSGDFYQLHPVRVKEEKIAFESPLWALAIQKNYYLKEIHRQKNDPFFIDILNEVRVGNISNKTWAILPFLKNKMADDQIIPTKLFSKNINVDKENLIHLNALEGETHVFDANDSVWKNNSEILRATEKHKDILDRSTLLPRKLLLKTNAQVILLKNIGKANLSNGSRGVIVGWVPTENPEIFYPKVKFLKNIEKVIKPMINEVEASIAGILIREQLPLKLAWALTIHKCQGMTLDLVECNLENTFAHGQAYVALSRARTMNGLSISKINRKMFFVCDKVRAFYSEIKDDNLI